MRTTTSTVLYSDSETLRLFREQCARVAELGGTFSFKHYYSGNWYVDIVINWPENISDDLGSHA